MALDLQLKHVASGPQPGGSGSVALTRKDVERILRPGTILLFVGLFGVIVTSWIYRPLDSNLIYITALVLFLFPMVLYVVTVIRKRETQQVERLRTIFRRSAALSIIFAGVLIANGALDQAPPRKIQSIVIRKYVTHGRRSTTYHVDVRSWRPGRTDEDLQVGSRTFSATAEGHGVSIELHAGFVGVQWYGRVSPL
jgi:uncharacterized membrane protein YiaA